MDTSSSLDSIWDEPAIINSPKRVEPVYDSEEEENNAQRPTKRSRQTLFLADSDDDDEFSSTTRVTHKAPPVQDVDVDALFAGIDDEVDDLLNFKRVPDRLDETQLARQAEAEARRRAPPLTPHQIMPSSSPVRDTENGAAGKKTNDKKGGDNDDEKKSRRRLVKLDENRLLGPSGFPQLIKMTKDFKIKGKGHEATDLNRLLQTYQYWTHGLYPKTNFRDTVERVEKLCHSRRMNVSLSVWRDDAHGKPSKEPEDSDDDNNEDARADQADDERIDTDDRNPDPRSSPSRASSRVSSPPASGPSSEGDTSIRPPAQNHNVPPEPSNREEDEQEDFWRSLDEFNGDVSDPPPAPTTAPNSSMDEDEDMWDIINEVEQETAAKRSIPAEVGNTSITQAVGNPPEDDDMDDIYV